MPQQEWNEEGTRIYGESDDLIEAEGEYSGECGKYDTDDEEKGVLLLVSDGTLFEIKYGKLGNGIWGIKVLKQGTLFDRIEFCDNEDEPISSDIVYLKNGIKWIYACKEWEKIE